MSHKYGGHLIQKPCGPSRNPPPQVSVPRKEPKKKCNHEALSKNVLELGIKRDPPFICGFPGCSLTFNEVSAFQKHRKECRHSDYATSLWKCLVCKKAWFEDYEQLKEHASTHKECPMCRKRICK